uniref:Mitochondrial amidoxime-reducing component 1 n=1 Tax=Cacopsylla melanoneura TaxID=428564 RepID=A0A8D8Q0N4_9HEMI
MNFTQDRMLSSIMMASAGAIAMGYLYWHKHLRYSRPKCELPERWTPVGRVSTILMYPLKSGYYKELDDAFCNLKGIEERENMQPCILRDRNFVLFDRAKGKFITAKVYEKITMVDVNVRGQLPIVEFSLRNGYTGNCLPYGPLEIDVVKVLNEAKTMKFKMHFNEEVKAYDCGDAASAWFSRYLLKSNTTRDIRLGMCCDDDRTIANSWDRYSDVYNLLSDEDTGRYSDIASYMIVNEESVNDLNTRVPCEEKFTSHYFRPNIVVKDCIPYEEDTWDWIKIGDAIFRVVKPCTRCIAITINPETGIKNSALEPIRTLRQYRRLGDIDEKAKHLEGQSPVMGVYAGLYHLGVIKPDDIVFVSSHQK